MRRPVRVAIVGGGLAGLESAFLAPFEAQDLRVFVAYLNTLK
jgi:protoporphyrinogen oxidase